MKYILDDKKIMQFLCDEKMSVTEFAKKHKMTVNTINRVLEGKPVYFSTVVKLANATNYHPRDLILGTIYAEDEGRQVKTDEYCRQLAHDGYFKWK